MAKIAEALRTRIRISIEINPIYETLSQRFDRILKSATSEPLMKLKALVVEVIKFIKIFYIIILKACPSQ